LPLLSLVVPVYRVEEYLADCLDSLLGQSFTDFEVIAVDDASDDGSAAILTRYAERDDRIRVVTLARNGGLGAARNMGITQAIGTYVWCVDSDDWLPAGTLAAVAARLEATQPDLLVTGYSRVYPDGTMEPHPVTEAGPLSTMPDTFTFAERPGLINGLWIACNKVIRREFLIRSGIQFGPGWYEDVAMVLPVMLVARRISLLDHDCYAYRQRPGGAITQTVSEHHFDVFMQWQKVFDFMDAVFQQERPGEFAILRPVIFGRMVWHLLQVLGHASRIPRARRRAYFRRMTEQYHRYLPPGNYPLLSGTDGIKQRLVARGAWFAFEVMMAAWFTVRPVARWLRPQPELRVAVPNERLATGTG
jgi:glycosyltransferase involved in cell wall biosynthesis